MQQDPVLNAVATILARKPGFAPRAAMILGSGLGVLADALEATPLAELPPHLLMDVGVVSQAHRETGTATTPPDGEALRRHMW